MLFYDDDDDYNPNERESDRKRWSATSMYVCVWPIDHFRYVHDDNNNDFI